MPTSKLHLVSPTTSQRLWALGGILIGMRLGIKFADIDQQILPWLLHHRALLTHGLILPFLAGLTFWRCQHHSLRGFTVGFCLMNAVHLSYDFFPKAWWGHALIHIFSWALPPILSGVWILVSILACIDLTRILMRTIEDIILSIGGAIWGFSVYAHEGFVFPGMIFIVAGIVAFLFPLFKHDHAS